MKNLIQDSGFIQGTELDDEIRGSNEIDFIEGLDGDDDIYGFGASDVINAGRGNDLVFGGEGDDEIDGQNGDDILYGEEGADDIAGGDGDDYLFGGAGTHPFRVETLNGEDGHDVLIGGADDDRLVGGDDSGGDPDDDFLVGTDFASAGVDEVDYLRGGQGADTFVLGEVKSTLEQDDLRKDELTGQTARQKQYYVDGGFNNGNDSYAVIEDFRPGQGDTIQLIDPLTMGGIYNIQQSYTVGASPIPGIDGQAIYLSSSYTFVPDDLIAIVRFGGNPDRRLNLNSRYMSFVGEPFEWEFELPPGFPFPIEDPIIVDPPL